LVSLSKLLVLPAILHLFKTSRSFCMRCSRVVVFIAILFFFFLLSLRNPPGRPLPFAPFLPVFPHPGCPREGGFVCRLVPLLPSGSEDLSAPWCPAHNPPPLLLLKACLIDLCRGHLVTGGGDFWVPRLFRDCRELLLSPLSPFFFRGLSPPLSFNG